MNLVHLLSRTAPFVVLGLLGLSSACGSSVETGSGGEGNPAGSTGGEGDEGDGEPSNICEEGTSKTDACGRTYYCSDGFWSGPLAICGCMDVEVPDQISPYEPGEAWTRPDGSACRCTESVEIVCEEPAITPRPCELEDIAGSWQLTLGQPEDEPCFEETSPSMLSIDPETWIGNGRSFDAETCSAALRRHSEWIEGGEPWADLSELRLNFDGDRAAGEYITGQTWNCGNGYEVDLVDRYPVTAVR